MQDRSNQLTLTLKSQISYLVLPARNKSNLVFNCNRDDFLNVNIRSLEFVLSPLKASHRSCIVTICTNNTT